MLGVTGDELARQAQALPHGVDGLVEKTGHKLESHNTRSGVIRTPVDNERWKELRGREEGTGELR